MPGSVEEMPKNSSQIRHKNKTGKSRKCSLDVVHVRGIGEPRPLHLAHDT